MSFPLYYILAPFALFSFIYAIFILMDLYHLAHFAEVHLVAFFATFIFLAGVIYILFWTWNLSQPINWNETVSILKNISFNQAPTF